MAQLDQVSKILVLIETKQTQITCLFIPNARPIIASNITNAIDPGKFTVIKEDLQQHIRLIKLTIRNRKALLN
jgi:hypothetical protein